MAKKDRGLEAKVGLFVFVGLFLLVGVIFLLGAERHVFDKRVPLIVKFDEIEGLKVGAPVRLAGLDVGTVREIGFSPDTSDRKLVVRLEIREAVLARVHEDSVATVGSRGLLGDKTIDITVGGSDSPALEPGGELRARNPADIFQLIRKADSILGAGDQLVASIKNIADELADSNVQKDLGRLLKTLADLADEVKGGNGFLHSLVYNDEYQERVFDALDDIVASTESLRNASQDINQIVTGVQEGPGALHALIYDPKGEALVAELGRAAGQIEAITRSVREEKGIAHRLIFAQEGADPVGDLALMAKDLRVVASRLKKGEGTIGALLRDPTVYEDLKLTLGEVRRNQLLKAVLRLAIEERDEPPPSLARPKP